MCPIDGRRKRLVDHFWFLMGQGVGSTQVLRLPGPVALVLPCGQALLYSLFSLPGLFFPLLSPPYPFFLLA